jgi:hypothetical protein
MSVTINNKHIKTAKVGKDTIENAEYITCDFTPSEKVKTFKNRLEDFCDTITWPFWKVKGWIRDTYWEVRYGFQRMFKGYDYVDTFETFAKFTERYEKILKDYKKCHYGHPGDMTVEAWEAVVDDMIYHLHYMDEQNVEDELSKGMPEDWIPSSLTVYEIMERHKDEFFKLFSKHFYNLWD